MTPQGILSRAAAAAAVALAVPAGVAFVAVTPAYASCAGPPEPSPYAFTGTVVETDAGGRVATVLTDDGREVDVVGTPDRSGVTSVDREYAVGGRYEFHPHNEASPYQDHLCTATRQLSGPSASQARGGSAVDALLWGDEESPPVAAGGAGAATVAALGVLILGWRRVVGRPPARGAH